MKKLTMCCCLFAFVAVNGSAQIQEPPPEYVLEWGGQGTGPGQFDSPGGIALNSAGHIYVADIFNHRIQKFDSGGSFLMEWGDFGSDPGQFHDPSWLAIDESDQVYVVDDGNNRIQVFDATGNFLREWGSTGGGPGEFVIPWGIDVRFGRAYVADYNQHRVQVFDTDGNFIMLVGGAPGSGNGEFNSPSDVAVDSTGNIYVVDFNNHRIQKFDNNFDFIMTWGTPGSGDGEFHWPKGIEVDPWDRVYVTEFGNARVQKFDSSGAFLTKWGAAGSDPGLFFDPYDLATNHHQEIFVSEGWQAVEPNYRMQKFMLQAGGYTTDFESFSQGTVNGQDDWWISGAPALDDGTIVDDGTGNQVLQILAGSDWGDEVGRHFVPVYSRYLAAEMDFQTKDGGGPFWFADLVPAPPDAVFWWANLAASNATPGMGAFQFPQDVWEHIGIEVDLYSREITAVNFSGIWRTDDDSLGVTDPVQLHRFYFRGVGDEERLWIDNIKIAGYGESVIVFHDSFESGDTSAWSAMVP